MLPLFVITCIITASMTTAIVVAFLELRDVKLRVDCLWESTLTRFENNQKSRELLRKCLLAERERIDIITDRLTYLESKKEKKNEF